MGNQSSNEPGRPRPPYISTNETDESTNTTSWDDEAVRGTAWELPTNDAWAGPPSNETVWDDMNRFENQTAAQRPGGQQELWDVETRIQRSWLVDEEGFPVVAPEALSDFFTPTALSTGGSSVGDTWPNEREFMDQDFATRNLAYAQKNALATNAGASYAFSRMNIYETTPGFNDNQAMQWEIAMAIAAQAALGGGDQYEVFDRITKAIEAYYKKLKKRVWKAQTPPSKWWRYEDPDDEDYQGTGGLGVPPPTTEWNPELKAGVGRMLGNW